ncbi:heterodisulfide reductase-related iron-sulfur binding cluster [uncultured Rubinisphaera sp.]|uniref:(Fe-S)-binding protein n=1 Tax=uncultured Rubinisphaera sp. TaxID=1678686 RepID=UPI0030DB4056
MTSPSSTSGPSKPQFAGYVSHEDLLTCIHCGLCTSSCPTYLETGNENDGPRGRIHLMRGIEEQRIELTEKARRHLDLCLDCRSCETACPSGVQYGQLIESFRNSDHQKQQAADPNHKESWFNKYILRDLFTDRHRLERILWPARLMQWLKLDRVIDATGIVKLLPTPLQRMHRMLPKLKPYESPLPERIDAHKRPARRKVGLFLGCVADGMFRSLHWATVRVLQEAGCDVIVPHTQSCCGAMDYHSGHTDVALQRARTNIEAFKTAGVEVILVNVAGCGAMLKEYGHLAQYATENAEELNQFAGQIRDINEFLAELNIEPLESPLPVRAVYQDACHLRHAQQIELQPRELLRKIPGLEIVSIPEANICCGAAGSYNLVEPEMSDRLGNRKLDHILEQNPDVIVSANVGCSLQLQALLKQRKLNIPVLHPVELLDASQRKLSWDELKK